MWKHSVVVLTARTWRLICQAALQAPILSVVVMSGWLVEAKAQVLTNGNFSDSVNPAASLTTFEVPAGFFSYQFDQSDVPGWSTTASDGRIEIWESGHLNVPAQDGGHFAEIIAVQSVSQLFQEFAVLPGDVVDYSVWHRGRDGVDVANVLLGPPSALVIQQTMTTNNTAWANYSGSYNVPTGVTTLRLAFESVSSSSPNSQSGNFIDNVVITIARPSITLSKSADNTVSRDAGDVVVYTYTVENTGATIINNVSITDSHNASGPPPDPDGEALLSDAAPINDSSDVTANDGIWSTLGPGDSIIFTGEYTVTQSDVDTLQ